MPHWGRRDVAECLILSLFVKIVGTELNSLNDLKNIILLGENWLRKIRITQLDARSQQETCLFLSSAKWLVFSKISLNQSNPDPDNGFIPLPRFVGNHPKRLDG